MGNFRIGLLALLWPVFACWGEALTSPWLGLPFEFESRLSGLYQTFHTVATGSHSEVYSSNDFFLNYSLKNSLPTPTLSVAFDATLAVTRKQKGQVDRLRLMGMYVWKDDVAGDPASVAFGLSYAQAFGYSLRDVSSFHHGLYNGEFFVTFGKERAFTDYWDLHWWGLVGIGTAEQGSPWVRFNLDCEKRGESRTWENHAVGAFVHVLFGTGDEKLHLHHFKGYGRVQHESIDLGLRYIYTIDCFGSATLEYSYRPYARNFPAYAQCLLLTVLYTFGL